MRNIIYQPWGGLGDNLAHSVIPELCHKTGIPCYLSNQNACRNQSIYDIIWSHNPYITGTRDCTDLNWLQETPDVAEITINGITTKHKILNQITSIQLGYGFRPEFIYPKIYFASKTLSEFSKKTVVDFSAHTISGFYNDVLLQTAYKDLINKLEIKEENIISLIPKINYSKIYSVNKNIFEIENLYNFCDVIASAKNFITLHSGASHLAATVKNHMQLNLDIYTFTFNKFINNHTDYNFPNVNYIPLD